MTFLRKTSCPRLSQSGEGRYGSYVDDAYVVGASAAELRRLVPQAAAFLREQLGLTLSRSCLRRMTGRLASLHAAMSLQTVGCSINSCLGITSHFAAFNIRLGWLSGPLAFAFSCCYFRKGILRYRIAVGKTFPASSTQSMDKKLFCRFFRYFSVT